MKLTKAQRELLSKIGRANAKAQSAAMTPEERKARARKASLARWMKKQKEIICPVCGEDLKERK